MSAAVAHTSTGLPPEADLRQHERVKDEKEGTGRKPALTREGDLLRIGRARVR